MAREWASRIHREADAVCVGLSKIKSRSRPCTCVYLKIWSILLPAQSPKTPASFLQLGDARNEWAKPCRVRSRGFPIESRHWTTHSPVGDRGTLLFSGRQRRLCFLPSKGSSKANSHFKGRQRSHDRAPRRR